MWHIVERITAVGKEGGVPVDDFVRFVEARQDSAER